MREDAYLSITYDGKDEEEGYDIFTDRIVHLIKNLPKKELNNYIEEVNAVYDSWAILAGLQQSLDWAGFRITVNYPLKNGEVFNFFEENFGAPFEKFDNIFYNLVGNTEHENIKLELKWSERDRADRQKSSYEIGFSISREGVAVQFEVNGCVSSINEIKELQKVAINIFSKCIEHEFLQKILQLARIR